MPIVSPPRTGRIYWTAFTQLEGDSEPTDPLRFDMYAQRLGNILFPGITQRVERLRYFGMVCAGLALTRPSGETADPREQTRLWRRRFLPFEAGWAFANLAAVNGKIKVHPPLVERARLKPEFRGLRGANRVLAYYHSQEGKSRVKPNNYRLLKAQASQGGLGSYLVALRRYGFVQQDRFELTALGQDLALSFLGDASRRAGRLLSRTAEPWRVIRSIGQALILTRPTTAEAQIVKRTLFEGSDTLATVFRRIPERLRSSGDAEEALQHIARHNGDPLERAAQYALTFDPFRRAALETFAELGRQLESHPPARLHDLNASELEGLGEETRATARSLAQLPAVSGLEPVADFAHRVVETSTTDEVLHAVVSFHHREGRRWIDVDSARRYLLGAHGAFDPPGDYFHGFTLPSAMRVYRDTVEALG